MEAAAALRAARELCMLRLTRRLQVIDDTKHITLVGLGSVSEAVQKALETEKKSATKTKARALLSATRQLHATLTRCVTSAQDAASVVGRMIAEKCKEKGIESVVFDRGGFKYHGRIMALADAAREAGLVF